MDGAEWLAREIDRMHRAFLEEHGRPPLGVIMSPQEHAAIDRLYRKLTDEEHPPPVGYVAGLQIFFKASKGVELVMDRDAAATHAMNQKLNQKHGDDLI